MKKLLFSFVLLCAAFPYMAYAHGFVADGHDGPLTVIDYIELGAITLGSLGLITYSFKQWKKNDKK